MDKKLLLSKYSNTLKLNNRNDSIILFKTTGSKINFTFSFKDLSKIKIAKDNRGIIHNYKANTIIISSQL